MVTLMTTHDNRDRGEEDEVRAFGWECWDASLTHLINMNVQRWEVQKRWTVTNLVLSC